MKATFYILYIFTLFVSISTASKSDWRKRYHERWQSRLYMILTKGFDEESMRTHSRDLLPYLDGSESTEAIRKVLRDADKSPFDLYSILIEILQPGFAELSKDYYKEQRDSSGASDEFGEFDAKFFEKLGELTYLFHTEITWDKLKGLSSKEEVMCEAAFFYGLIDFERAITCLDAAPRVASLDCRVISNFVVDMHLGEANRPDFSYEGDTETRKWLNGMVEKYEGVSQSQTTSLMRRFTRNIKDKILDESLWTNYMRAMMTVHLSAALLEIKTDGLKYLYDYLADNRIHDEYMFASEEREPLQPGQTVQNAHGFLRTFKFDPFSETATMGIINSGEGLQFHDKAQFNLSELPDTIPEDPHAKSVIRYIPYIVYDAVPRGDWDPAYTIVDTADKAYFEHKQRKHKFGDYKKWQYVDPQRAGTCSAMSLWSALYWFERENQQKLELFRLTLYLEVLKGAADLLGRFREYLEELDRQRSELADSDPKWNELHLEIIRLSEFEDDYFRFFSVGFNSAIRSIRYLHTDPFGQGLNMTSIMQDYAVFYDSQAGEKCWRFVKPNIDDLFHSTYLRVMRPMVWVTPLNRPRIIPIERSCSREVNLAIKAKSPFNFAKAVISGTDLKCQSKTFLASIQSGIGALDLHTHHQDLILRALAKEIRSLQGGRMPILRLVHRLINDYDFKFFPAYDVPPITKTNFTVESRQVFIFDDDTEVVQFAANCGAFELLGKNVLAAAYDLVKSTRKALPDLVTRVNIATTEEYKLHEDLVQRAAIELQSIDPHLHTQYLASLIWNAEETGIADHLNYFKPSEGWNQDDYTLLERATKGSGPHGDTIKKHFGLSFDLAVGRGGRKRKHFKI